MREIETLCGKKILVDGEDFHLLSRHNWYLNGKGYAVTSIGGKHVRIHRFVFGKVPPSMVVDHINRNKLDNRRSNLRAVSHQENAWNSPVCEGTDNVKTKRTSNYVGIRRRNIKGRIKFEASATVSNKEVYIGKFDDEIDAVKMRDAFIYNLRGRFAYLNFPDLAPEYEVWEFPERLLKYLE